MRKLFKFIIAILLGATPVAHAVVFDTQDIKFGINGYLDLEYTYMTKMPMVMGNMIKATGDSSTFEQKHMNLLFDAEKGKLRMHLNFQSQNAYTTEDGGKGEFALEESYGEYTVNDGFKVRAGKFLMPFGIYNDIHYITSLFATVVLPQMYEPPAMYSGTRLLPSSSNVMVSGTYFGDETELSYSLYAGNGARNSNGGDTNKDKQIGTRLKLTLFDNLKIGTSYCTVNDNLNGEGRNNIYGADLEVDLFDETLNFQSEYVLSKYDNKSSRYSYYARLTYDLDKFNPFIAYDYFMDKEDLLYKKGMNRLGVGTGYAISDNFIIKGEYHYHFFSQKDGLPDGTEKFHMLRFSTIFIF
ncbi:MAG: OprO/OprP family phosphate-selective porin [Sulfurimonas sp.]|nr:OprO/OprP family phosphate-selective porin [Sulfurimonas sp.]